MSAKNNDPINCRFDPGNGIAVFKDAQRGCGYRQEGVGNRQDEGKREAGAHGPPPPEQPEDQCQKQQDIGMRQRLQ